MYDLEAGSAKGKTMADISAENIARLQEFIREAETIAITAHMHPDGDAMGSVLGMFNFLEAQGKKAEIVLNDRYPESLSFLVNPHEASHITSYDENPGKAESLLLGSDLVFCQDFNAFSRTEHLSGALASTEARKVLIDHHLNPERSAFTLSFSETQVSSTAELLYYILLAFPETEGDAALLPARTARALMAGMTTDTNNFANSVFPTTFRMASGLLSAGVDRDGIIADIYNSYRENRFRLMGSLLKDRLTITPDGVAYMILDMDTARQFDVKEGETEGFVNLPLGIRDVKMSIFIKAEKDRFRVSVRSKKGISANLCARRYFNGGGHEQAAGGRLTIGTDISADILDVAGYIEKCTHEFFSEN